MSIRTTVASLAALCAFAIATGCEIHDCKDGAICSDYDDDREDARRDDTRAVCVDYCVRLSVCGAPRAEDFDACVSACEQRFQRAPEKTRELCECAEWSLCSDVIEGRCSPQAPPSGAGGRPAAGGAPGVAGAASGVGGSPASGGGLSTGGAPMTSGGTGGCSAGAGGANAAGTAGAPAGGESVAGGEAGEGGASSCSCP